MALREEGYWDKCYEEDLSNYEDHGDEGQVWFGKGLSRRISTWIIDRINNNRSQYQQVPSIVDIGCGNAFLLYTLAEMMTIRMSDMQLRLLGLDYSSNSIKLSKKIVESKNLTNHIELKECDFLDMAKLISLTQTHKFNFIVDVGTYDAICLLASPMESDSDDDLKKARTRYVKSLGALSENGTVFILASCNYTEPELIGLLRGQGNHDSIGVGRSFNVMDRIETPRMQFGGKEGSQVCCLIIEFGCQDDKLDT